MRRFFIIFRCAVCLAFDIEGLCFGNTGLWDGILGEEVLCVMGRETGREGGAGEVRGQSCV